MKFIQKSAFVFALCSIVVLSSCHRSGCPGQITDTFEQSIPNQEVACHE